MKTKQQCEEGDSSLGDKLIDLETVADNLGIGARTVWRSVARGEIPPPVKVGRCSRWFTSDVVEYKERLRAGRN